MPKPNLNPVLLQKLTILKAVIKDNATKAKLETAFHETNGNFAAVAETLHHDGIASDEIKKIDFADSLSAVTDNNEKLVTKFFALPNISTMREFAFANDKTAIAKLLSDDSIPKEIKGKDLAERKLKYSTILSNKIFNTETSAVLHRMVNKAELPIADGVVRNGLSTFFSNQPEFNIRTTSVYSAIKDTNAFKGIEKDAHEGVVKELKTLQRLQAISTSPEAMGHLMEAKLQTAFQVSEMTQKDFVKIFSKKLSKEEALTIHTNASHAKAHYDKALVAMKEYTNGVTIAAVDGKNTAKHKAAMAQKFADEKSLNVNWENLFGSVDFCECGECNSVYSPAAYFVELLQYLRNNNLDNAAAGGQAIKTDPKDISDTALERLFDRRPDLGCLELTCKNTNTVLPYVDLVNEVMESFITHLNPPRIEPWNVEDETTGELLAQPQHINYDAYCILKKSVYPFTLPYHQPIDAIRIFLKSLDTSRYEVMKTFRSSGQEENKNEELPEETVMPAASPNPDKEELKRLNEIAIDRAIDAEYLNITQEEFIILTKQAFWDKKYFDIKCNKSFTEEEYRNKIGVKHVWEYYGYDSEDEMLGLTAKEGLTFVKNQFLKRTGLLYVDLVELLKTHFINPNLPQGKALTILEGIHLSYRYLQTLVDTSSNDPKVRFAKLINILERLDIGIALYDMFKPNPCKPNDLDWCLEKKDWKKWVCCYFEKIGKLIVLESGDAPKLSVFGDIYDLKKSKKLGLLTEAGAIYNDAEVQIGKVSDNVANSDVGVVELDGKTLFDCNIHFGINHVIIVNKSMEQVGMLIGGGMIFTKKREEKPFWFPIQDSCDINKIRLKHLDGTDVTTEEYDKIHRFIRLKNKLGWTIDETDKALTGLAKYKLQSEAELPAEDDCENCFDEFEADCECEEGEEDCGCTPAKESLVYYDITPDFLHQLVAVKKLLDKTGIELIKLLTFWTDISVRGEKSLYSRLFLTHNMTGIDKIFMPDKNGNYLSKKEKLSDHIPVLMAAFNLKAEDVASIISFKNIPDELTIRNITIIYRYSLLMKALHVRSLEMKEIIVLFGNPFTTADVTHEFLEVWGKMEDAGFTLRHLNYLIRDVDDIKKPLKPKQRMVLQLAKTLYDGLNQIDKDHPDLAKIDEETILQLKKNPPLTDVEKRSLFEDKATEELIRTKTSLIFDQTIVESVVGILQGTSTYNTNAPKNLVATAEEFISKLTADLKKKLKYDFVNGGIQVTGLLTDKEKTDAKALFNPPDWSLAIDRVGKQALYYFNDVLAGIFKDKLDEAKTVLLQGDINIAAEQQDVNNPVINTPPVKRKYFIENFLPFLRQQLTHRFLIDTISSACGLEKKITDVLISEVLEETTDVKKKIIEIFKSVKYLPIAGSVGWKGYLLPTKDDDYIFAVTTEAPLLPISIEGTGLKFTQQADPSNLWLSDPVKLLSGKSYFFEATGLTSDLNELAWKTSSSPKAPIPASVLLPDYSYNWVNKAFIKLQKAAILVNGFVLNEMEIPYLQNHGSDFDAFDFNSISLASWKRIEAYTRFRNSLPQTDTTTIEFFKWANQTTDAAKLSETISTLTQWKKEDIDKLIASSHFNLNKTEYFRNEINLIKLQKALYVADKISMDINLLFDWAKPSSRFWPCHEIAESIRKAIRARYKQEDWEQVVKPLNDELRENQKNALIAYLLVQQDLIDWGVVDADSLFEFFLIDVQMCSCMETSRIKQAISSVQLFVQRCFLGLEVDYGVATDVLDRARWNWMQRHRVWEANRKVFLYPENWIEEELRDDKSPFYKELESELLQKDINKQTVQDALKSYLYKVDEVSNMQVVGLFLDEANSKIHIFSRTRNAPYFFYYRYYNISENSWMPWDKIQIDIPCYDLEDSLTNRILMNGCYVNPFVFDNRLLIFFPQFIKKTKPNSAANSNLNTLATNSTNAKPIEFWEIKMAFSEFRNGKWTQKQISKEGIYHGESITAPNIADYIFQPRRIGDNIIINVYFSTTNHPEGTFKFSGNKIEVTVLTDALVFFEVPANRDFHYQNSIIRYSLVSADGTNYVNPTPLCTDADDDHKVTFTYNEKTENFYYEPSHSLLSQVNNDDLGLFFSSNLNLQSPDDVFGGKGDGINYNELKKPYSIYSWELFFHTPATIADKLSESQHFEEAMKWYHYIFNPFENGIDPKEAWQFYPFKNTDATNILESFFNSLKPNEANAEITEWRNKPFNPHVIARSRPSAYMKWIVMKYIDNLIAWADYLFRQDTIETLNQATQLYILAYHIMGQRPQMIPKRGRIKPETYKSLLNKWDAFGNAMVEMELIFPFSNQINEEDGKIGFSRGFANIFGFASSLYFCIPNNPKLLGYWDTIADRLYKIRHCENIDGVFRKLALWDPPIDPALLVQATAQGISLDSVLNDLNTPLPNYRFNYLIQKALELCNELKSMGGALLSVFEKKDAEVLSKMRSKHESAMHNLVMEIKKMQLEEATKALDGLLQNRKSPEHKMKYYLKLVGEDINKVPGATSDFSELTNTIETPVSESGLKLIKYEKEDMDKANEAANWQIGIGITETLAGIFNIIPAFSVDGKPFGIGAGFSFGGPNLGSATSAVAKALQTYSSHLSFQSSSAAKKGGFLRQLQDRVLQLNLAGFEIKQIDKQITSQQIRIKIAEQEILNQQKQIDNANEVEEFLKNKYTNEELYSWMEGSVKTLYHQVYTLAYDLAKKAEKVYRFERGLTNSNFIQFGYWDASRDGLHAGERMYVGIKQLEAAYQEKRGYDYEITKHVSLRQINPLALIELKEKGKCEFDLSEVFFDMDYPGHYMRRIKSVSLSIPCIAGPYTSINGTLRLLENKFRISSISKDGRDYLEKTEEADPRFTTVNIPITSIAASSGQNDSGMFELNFKDERYMPFEGAGTISKWRLEFPSDFRQFDYQTISDAIIHVRYTSIDGGEKLKSSASESLKNYIKSVEELSQREGLFTIVDLKNDYANEWYKAINAQTGANGKIMQLGNVLDRLPIYTKTFDAKKIKAKDMYIAATSSVKNTDVTLVNKDTDLDAFGGAIKINESINLYHLSDQDETMDNWSLRFADTIVEPDKMWMLVRYTLNN